MKSADDKDAVNHVNIEIAAKESQVFCDSPDCENNDTDCSSLLHRPRSSSDHLQCGLGYDRG